MNVNVDDARRRRIVISNKRWRAIFALLALIVPAAIFGLFRRQELRLRALVEHGQPTEATLSHVSRQGSAEYAHYAYEVGGVTYTWSVSRSEAPYAPGQSFPVTFLPEDPSLSRPTVPYSREQFDAELNVPVRVGFPLGSLVFFAGAALLCHRGVRRMERNETLRTRPRLSPHMAGRILAAILLLAILGASFDPKVRNVQVALMGPRPLGVPAVFLASAVQAVLFAPLFWMMPHLLLIVTDAQSRGRGYSKLGIILAMATAPEHLRRSRALVVCISVYFVVLFAAWIALTSIRGV